MARKGWDSLSPDYKARLARNGISKTAYERGESIKAARGHEHTPERPKQAQAGGFRTYQDERNKLTRKIIDRKQWWFGTSPKYNPTRSNRKFRDSPPPMNQLKQWARFTKEEWLDEIRSDRAAAEYLGYH